MVETQRPFRPVIEVVSLVAGQSIGAAASFAGVCLLTYVLAPEEYGRLALALTGAAFIHQTVYAPLAGGISRFFPGELESARGGELGWVVRRALSRSVRTVLVPVALVAAFCATSGSARVGVELLLVSTLSFAAAAAASLDAALIAGRAHRLAAIFQGFTPILRFGSGLAGAAVASTAAGALSGYSLGVAAAALVQWCVLPRSFAGILIGPADSEHSRDLESRFLDYVRPFHRWSIWTWTQSSADRWSLGWCCGSAVAGRYSLSFQLGYYPVTLAVTVIEQFLIPRVFCSGSDSRRAAIRGAAAALAVGLGSVACWMFLGRAVWTLLVDPRYHLDLAVPVLLTAAAALFGAGQVISLEILRRDGSAPLFPLKRNAAIAGIVAAVAGTWWLGQRGAALAVAIHGLLYLLMTACSLLRNSEILADHPPVGEPLVE